MDKIRKKITHVFKDNGFSIAIMANLVEVNFLDVSMSKNQNHINLINAKL